MNHSPVLYGLWGDVMDFQLIQQNTVSSGKSVLESVQNIFICEAYCVQAELYRNYLRQNRELAYLYLNIFREANDMIFQNAMEILDLAIQEANVPLAECALQTVNAMKDTYPKFYKSYVKQLFGR